ncbi:MAG: shikimate dehydrogenase [Kineosporiaceae bacterium]
MTPRRAAVLGSPIAHSLSPVLHRAAYAQLGLTAWRYEARECDEAGLEPLVRGLQDEEGWVGLSLTMPLKRVVFGLLGGVSDVARSTGAVNTVLFAGPPGGEGHDAGEPAGEGPWGTNTDVGGIVAALAEIGVVRAERAVVLGGGATAASAVAALAELGCLQPSVLVRDPARATATTEAGLRLGVRPRVGLLEAAVDHLDAQVWISTLPGTAGDAVAARLPAGVELPALLDVTYHPWPTGLGAVWQREGGCVVGGLSMLVHQAAEQVRLMTGSRPDVEVMRAAALAEIARRG